MKKLSVLFCVICVLFAVSFAKTTVAKDKEVAKTLPNLVYYYIPG